MAQAYVEYPISGTHGQGRSTLIDVDTFEALRGRTVCMSNQYVVMHKSDPVTRKRGGVKLHRWIMGIAGQWDGVTVVDHINRNPLDNRRTNLRITTQRTNVPNLTPPRGPFTQGIKFTHGKWRVETQYQRVRHYLGSYVDQKEAWRVAENWRRVNIPGYIPKDC